MHWVKPDIHSDWWLVGKAVIKGRKGGMIPMSLSRQGAQWDNIEWRLFKRIKIDHGGGPSSLACQGSISVGTLAPGIKKLVPIKIKIKTPKVG